jgi:hypothetical protein
MNFIGECAMADPGRATAVDNDAEIRGSVRQATLVVLSLALVEWKRPSANALKLNAASDMSA